MYQNYFTPYNYGQQYYQPQFQQQQMSPTQMSGTNLNGKIVGSVEEARGMDVPVGSVGYYPNGNGSEIYVKSWQTDGSTKIDVYERKLVSELNPNSNDIMLDDIYNSIQSLSKKIDGIVPKSSSTTTAANRKKKVGEEDE